MPGIGGIGNRDLVMRGWKSFHIFLLVFLKSRSPLSCIKMSISKRACYLLLNQFCKTTNTVLPLWLMFSGRVGQQIMYQSPFSESTVGWACRVGQE
jgi:hypothetical protein